MTVFQGSITPNAVPFSSVTFAGAGSEGAVVGQHVAAVVVEGGGNGSVDVNLPATRPSTQTIAGAYETSFYNDFYERLWVIPDDLDAGVISAHTVRNVPIWNAYRTTSTWSGVTATGDESVDITSIPPTLAPFTMGNLVVEIDKDGEPISKTSFALIYGARGAAVEVRGVRAKAWMFEPDWSSEFSADYEFRTEVITSRDGTEQRIAVRDKPRVSYSFSVMVDDYDFRNFAGFANSWQARATLMPDWSRLVEVNGDVAVGETTLNLKRMDVWMTAGATVSITWGDRSATKQLISTVDFVAGNSVNLTSGVTETIPSGAIVTPLYYGRLDGTMSAQHKRERIAAVNVKFNVEPGYESLSAAAAVQTYDGRELFMLEPDLTTDITTDFTSFIETLDYGYGRTAHFTPITFNDRVAKMSYLGAGRVEVDALRDLFIRQRGQQGEFFMPTFTEDLRMKVALSTGQSVMRVIGVETSQNYANLKVFRDICIVMRDGTTHKFRIVEINPISDSLGADSVLTLQTASTSTINPADVFMVCWLPLWRFVTDKLTVQWRTDQVASVAYAMKTIPYVEAET